MLAVIRAAFLARPRVDPAADALSDTVADIEAALASGAGILALLGDELVGCLLISRRADAIGLHRVSVHPDHRHAGIASELVLGAVELGMQEGADRVAIMAREEFPQLIAWWRDHEFEVESRVEHGYILTRALPVRLAAPTADAMRELGERLAGLLRPGDVVIVNGELGAGKTTLTQGIGAGLGVASPVISPTFVLSRVHPNSNGPALVHVDAYRLSTPAELEDIDLESGLAEAVTIIEWGEGVAEWLSPERLVIDIERSADPRDDGREVYLTGLGHRWVGVLPQLREPA